MYRKLMTYTLLITSLLTSAPSFGEKTLVYDEDFETGVPKNKSVAGISESKGKIVENKNADQNRFYFSSTSTADNAYVIVYSNFLAKGALLSFDYRIDSEKYPNAYISISPKTEDGRIHPLSITLAPKLGEWVHWEGVIDDLLPKTHGKKVVRILIRTKKIPKAKKATHTLSIDNIKISVDATHKLKERIDKRTKIPNFLKSASEIKWAAPVNPAEGGFTVLKDGKAVASIILGKNKKELLPAAEALAKHIKMISGATLAIIEKSNGPAIHLKLDSAIPRERYRLNVTSSKTTLTARDAWSLELGVYELLRKLGVNWFMPGKNGCVVVKSSTIKLPLGKRSWQPRYSIRDQVAPAFNNSVMGLKARTEFNRWTRHLGARNSQVMTNHNFFRILPPKKIKEHPEYFALVDGKPTSEQIRTTSPKVIQIATNAALKAFKTNPNLKAYSLSPNDNNDWDERPEATKLDNPPVRPGIYGWPFSDVGPRLIEFVNAVAAGTAPSFPDKWIFTYVMYHRQQKAKSGLKVHPNVILGTIFHNRNYCNPIDDPNDYWNTYEWEAYKEWVDITPRLFIRTYMPAYRIGGIPFRRPKSDIHDMKCFLDNKKALGFKNEICIVNWSCNALDFWMRSMWALHPEMSVDELYARFHSGFYGPARKEMAAYNTLAEWSLMNAPVVVTPGDRAFRSIPLIFPEFVIKRMREYLNLALVKVDGEKQQRYRDRLKLAEYGQSYLEKMYSAVTMEAASDPIQALKNMDEALAIAKKAWNFDKHAFHFNEKMEYMDSSFFYEYKRIKKIINIKKELKILKDLNSGWLFRPDIQKEGVEGKWFEANDNTKDWSEINIGSYWEHQGHLTLDGDGWYKLRFFADPSWMKKSPALFFCGIDDSATIYINGQLVKEWPFKLEHPSWKTPCEIPLTKKLISFGEENSIVVRVNDKSGLGGLYMPVFVVAKE